MNKKIITVALIMGVLVPGFGFAKASKKQISGQLNLNTASVQQLDQLPSMSAKKAQWIVDYRKDHPFKSVDELDNVKGFSPKGIDKIRSHVNIDGPNSLLVEGGKSKKSKRASGESRTKKSKKISREVKGREVQQG